ncbi:MAG TPA: NfeD family protein [Anaerolineales bacterium]|nr:NfeD family protein [Anaerolineales bacterium]
MQNPMTLSLCLIGTVMTAFVLLVSLGIRVVHEDTRLAVYRLGRYIGDKGPGLVFLIPIIDVGRVKKLGEPVASSPSLRLVGAAGETLSPVFRDGKVLLPSGEWDAISQTPIATGRRVRVVRMVVEIEEES